MEFDFKSVIDLIQTKPHMKNYFVTLAILLFAFACQSNKPKQSDNTTLEPIMKTESVFTIALDKNINNLATIGLKDLASDVEYIKLEFTPECPMSKVIHFVATQNYFFVPGGNGIYQFSRNGNFIRKVGNFGKGPGEYLGFRDFAVDEEGQRLFVLTNWTSEILIYDFNGNYLDHIRLKDSSIEKFDYVGDSILALHVAPIDRNSLLFAELINERGESLAKVNSLFVKPTELHKWMGANLVYSYQQNVYVKEFYNDTIFHITPKGLEPYFILVLGKYAPPVGYSNDDRHKYIQPYRIFENDQSIIIFFNYDRKRCVAQYNRETGKTRVTIPESEDQQGIMNDLDGGMNFFMKGVPLSLKTTQNEWLMPVTAIELLEACKDKAVTGKLAAIISDLKEDDNPVIMVVKFKN